MISHRRPKGSIPLITALIAFGCVGGHAAQAVDFTKDILPIFESRCFECHDGKKSKADLRLDDREHAFKGGESGPAIVPRKSDESLLLKRIATKDSDERMPPKGEPLTAEEISKIQKWIDAGANWPASNQPKKTHWAFVPPTKPAVPKVKQTELTSPIDRFIQAKLDEAGLAPAPMADKITLLRRLSLDLIGLPPTIEEVEAFVNDESPDAYRKQVERLLKSPHYGERWGRHWLDAARYADSDGFEKDKSRTMWPYRDWVINALNRDMPYNEFVRWQIAGDEIPNSGQDGTVAMGFLRNAMVNEEGGVHPEQFRMDAMFDRMDAIGKSVLGLTIQCAQCHNHKFDPISQEEYYRMFAFLNNDHESQLPVYSPDELMKVESITRSIREIEADLRHKHADWEERMAKWEKEAKEGLPTWTVAQGVPEDISTGGQKYLPQPDGSFLALSYAPTKHTVRIDWKTDLTNITAVQLEQLTDPNLPFNGPGRSLKGTSALTEFFLDVASADEPDKKTRVKFSAATADYSNPEMELESHFDDRSGKKRVTGPVAFAIDEKQETAWGIDAGPGRRNQARKAVFQLSTNIGVPQGTIVTFHLQQNHGGWNSDDHMNKNLGRFRLSVTTNSEAKADPVPKAVRELLVIEAEKRTEKQTAEIFNYWRTTVPEFAEANSKIEELWKQWPTGASVLTFTKREEPRETKLLKRGDFLKPGKAVEAGVPAFLHPLPKDAPATRLTFANWLVDPKSPTTARVIVNRVWQSYFGTGLVTTPEDLGTQAEAPSHPELLDYLAIDFMEKGWSLKELHRMIVTSATYRRSSKTSPEHAEKDPTNKLLARAARFRVEGEIVRDITLAASGLLNPAVGGPSLFAPAPAYLFQPPASYGPFTWNEEAGTNRHRRAIYTFRRRSTPYPFLQTFDVPNGDFSCVRRLRSNTPLQALMALNETVSMEAAQGLASRALRYGGATDEARIEYAFRLCLSRKPTVAEREELIAFLERQRRHIVEGWVNPFELATGKNERPKSLPEGANPTQLAAYTAVSRVLLNLDETITKE
ncbi:MAG TPA: PSD1 and planctomycete cytochrome C domain-containing protein [Methylomirabilota bacterium]|nr:PSD1 and planctomycete cytochrome C domain-containing protein [Methylomirabilota bacterium]